MPEEGKEGREGGREEHPLHDPSARIVSSYLKWPLCVSLHGALDFHCDSWIEVPLSFFTPPQMYRVQQMRSPSSEDRNILFWQIGSQCRWWHGREDDAPKRKKGVQVISSPLRADVPRVQSQWTLTQFQFTRIATQLCEFWTRSRYSSWSDWIMIALINKRRYESRIFDTITIS